MQLIWDGQVSTGTDLLDTDLRDMHILSTASGDFLYTTTGQNGGISLYSLDTPGTLASFTDSQYFTTSGMAMGPLEAIDIDGTPHLILAGTGNGALAGYGLAPDGTLTPLALHDLPGSGVETAAALTSHTLAGGNTALYMIDGDTGTLHGLISDGAGALTGTASPAAHNFTGTTMLAAATSGGTPFLLAADGTGNLRSYQIDATTGDLTFRDSLGIDDGLGIATPTAIQAITAHGATWVILAGAGSGSLSVMQLAPNGQLSASDHILDTQATRFGGVSALKVVGVGDHVFVLAGGADDGLSLFALLPDGRLVHLQSLAHSTGSGLENITGIEAVQQGDALKIFVTSASSPGLAQFSLPLDDLGAVIAGTGTTPVQGGGGDDILVAGPAGGVLSGGTGADIFVAHPTTGILEITDFQPGQDRLDLSNFPMLRSFAQLDFTATATGAEIGFGDTVMVIHSDNGQPLLPADLWPAGFTTPDRLTIPDDLVIRITQGTMADDILIFDAGQDQIWGLAGKDTLSSGAGKDRLFGGGGADTLIGGAGADRLKGGSGGDTLKGGGGADRMDGGAGHDILKGSTGNDTLRGGGGKDTLTGGPGADVLKGGAGADTFIFAAGHGTDVISDFTPGLDDIRINITGTTGFGDLVLTAQGADTIIDTGDGFVTLNGISPGDLSPGDFLFS